MHRFRSHLRLIGTAAAFAVWLLLATHFCVGAGEAHAPVMAHADHGDDDSRGADLAHPGCAPAVSADRDPGAPPMVAHGGTVAASLAIGNPAPHAPVACPADGGRARSAPLYLLHATFLI